MRLILILAVLSFFAIIGNLEARNVKKDELKDASTPRNAQDVNSFDYDFANTPRRYSSYHRFQQKSSPLTTTRRQFVSYWQNLMRNVRLPVPSITWNVTNPLANLFNLGTEGYAPVEEVVDDYYEGTTSQRRHKNQKRRKQHNKSHRKHKRPHDHDIAEEQQLELENSAQQMLPQYPTINNNVDFETPMYFYDPNSNSYFAVQRVRSLGSAFNPAPTNEIPEDINLQQTEPNANEEDISDDGEDGDDINLDEAEEIDLDQVTENEVNEEQSEVEKHKIEFINEETLRNVLGTFMRDDLNNRQKQHSKEKKNLNTYKQIKPSKQHNYYFLLDVNSK